MNYELAKRLKETGFPHWPFPTRNNDVYFRGVLAPFSIVEKARYENGSLINIEAECVFIPALSELIEACGKSFYELRRLNEPDGHIWEASSPDVTPMIYVSTIPEIAVANLWLALNKK